MEKCITEGDTGLILMGTRVGKRVRACSRRQGGGEGVPGLRGERLLICDESPGNYIVLWLSAGSTHFSTTAWGFAVVGGWL